MKKSSLNKRAVFSGYDENSRISYICDKCGLTNGCLSATTENKSLGYLCEFCIRNLKFDSIKKCSLNKRSLFSDYDENSRISYTCDKCGLPNNGLSITTENKSLGYLCEPCIRTLNYDSMLKW